MEAERGAEPGQFFTLLVSIRSQVLDSALSTSAPRSPFFLLSSDLSSNYQQAHSRKSYASRRTVYLCRPRRNSRYVVPCPPISPTPPHKPRSSASPTLTRPPKVAASPIRVVVTEVSSSVRYGHATGDGPHVAHIAGGPIELIAASSVAQPVAHAGAGNGSRRWCHSMRTKALDASNALRQMLGLEPIDRTHERPHHIKFIEPVSPVPGPDGPMPVLPFVGTPIRPAFVADGDERPMDGPARRPMWHPHRRLRGSFLRRVHHALMTLGPWEGRAVAFVLGEYLFLCPPSPINVPTAHLLFSSPSAAGHLPTMLTISTRPLSTHPVLFFP